MSRMKTIRASLALMTETGPKELAMADERGPMLRFIAISATIPNIEDVSERAL